MEETPKIISMTPMMKHIKIDHSPNALTLVFQITDNRSRSLKIQQSINITIDTAENENMAWLCFEDNKPTPVDITTVIVVAFGERNNALTSPQMTNIIPIRKHSYERLSSSTYLLVTFKFLNTQRMCKVGTTLI